MTCFKRPLQHSRNSLYKRILCEHQSIYRNTKLLFKIQKTVKKGRFVTELKNEKKLFVDVDIDIATSFSFWFLKALKKIARIEKELKKLILRSAQIAEGYNWTFRKENRMFSHQIHPQKQKRDKTYKTGELRRLNVDGNVECAERADDQNEK